MSKKNLEAPDDHEPDNESEARPSELPETAPAGEEALQSKLESPAPDSSESRESADEASVDDLLEGIRRSLREEAAESAEKKPRWWKRAKKGKSQDQAAAEAMEEPLAVAPVEKPQADDTDLQQIDQLINMLDAETKAPAVKESKAAETPLELPTPPAEPEPAVDVEELKKRVFERREPAAEQEISEVRTIALEGGEEVFVEVEAGKTDARQDRLKAFENSLRPYLGYIYWVTAFVGIIMVIAVSAVLVRVYQQTRPPEPTKAVSSLPYPTSMALPGGLSFALGRGAITDGQWNPRGPEWLEGTEVCRWVAIPWSLQLEAVVRTLTQKDAIQLAMSNNDRLSYNVYSIQQLTLAEMQDLDQNTPCLLLVLAKQDSEKRWVVTAKP